MKYIKITAIIFIFTICLAYMDVKAENAISFIDVKIKSMSASTTVTSREKTKYGYQTAKKYSARDNLSGDDRAVKGMVSGSSWINLPTQTNASWTDEITYFPASYVHYVKATKNTLSTVSYSGIWYWDIQV